MGALYRLVRQSGVGPASLLLMTCLAVLSSLLAVLPPHFLGAIVNTVTNAGAQGNGELSPIPVLGRALDALCRLAPDSPMLVFSLLFLAFSCIAVVVRNIFVVQVSIYADRFIAHTRKECCRAVVHAEKKDIARYAAGDVVHRVMSDTKQLEYLVGPPLYVLCSDVFDLLWVSAFLLLLDWKILCMLLSIFPVLYFLSQRTGRRQRALAKKSQEVEALCTGFVQRLLSGLDTIKVFGAEEKECRDFTRLTTGIYDLEVKSSLSLGSFFSVEGTLRAAGSILVIAYAAGLAMNDPAYAGAIPVLIIYTQRFYAPLGNWARFYQVIQKSIVSFHRILDVIALRKELQTEGATAQGQDVFPLRIDGSVTLESGKKVSLNIGLDKPGLVILRGKSGVGKTQFTKSLLSIGSSFEGELRLGARRFSGIGLLAARKFFAHASQDAHFFPGSIAENLAYPAEGEAIDRGRCQDILAALDLAHFSLDAEVREYGGNLSLGEGRRIILGRALYARRSVLVLDEIDANVDMATRGKIYSLVSKEKEQRPVVMITHANTAELASMEHTAVIME